LSRIKRLAGLGNAEVPPLGQALKTQFRQNNLRVGAASRLPAQADALASRHT
jgi:hypothetical protein